MISPVGTLQVIKEKKPHCPLSSVTVDLTDTTDSVGIWFEILDLSSKNSESRSKELIAGIHVENFSTFLLSDPLWIVIECQWLEHLSFFSVLGLKSQSLNLTGKAEIGFVLCEGLWIIIWGTVFSSYCNPKE